jgi:hypothetical protein
VQQILSRKRKQPPRSSSDSSIEVSSSGYGGSSSSDDRDSLVVNSSAFGQRQAAAEKGGGLEWRPRVQRGASGCSPDWVKVSTELAPYLLTSTAHFIHELRTFLATPFPLSTYDRFVQYPPPRLHSPV